jgi:uncharacterized membrane protein
VTSYARSALWIVPFLSILAVLISVPILRVLDAWLEWDMMSLGVEGSKSMYQTVITLNMSFLIFTFGSLLVAIQIAGGQLTPRVIATTLLRDNVVRYSVGLFVFGLIFSVMALNRMEDKVHDLVTFITGCLGVATIVVFLFLIDYAARLLRPVSILARVAEGGLHVIARSIPIRSLEMPTNPRRSKVCGTGRRGSLPHTGRSEIVLAVDLETVMRERAGPGEWWSSCRTWATSSPPTSLYSRSTAAPPTSTIARCARPLHSDLNGRWNRTRCSRSGSWSTSR